MTTPPSRDRPDHPRIRGEHSPLTDTQTAPAGSSPHTRGARRRRCPAQEDRRIIPAYAGSTWMLGLLAGLRRDHPRIRGEHLLVIDELQGLYGSSPHTRGARPGRRRRGQGARIIPAYAGSTGSSRMISMQSPDHPRIRGEHRPLSAPRRTGRGSSPHTRGARLAGQCGDSGIGIIPAYAGSTLDFDALAETF